MKISRSKYPGWHRKLVLIADTIVWVIIIGLLLEGKWKTMVDNDNESTSDCA